MLMHNSSLTFTDIHSRAGGESTWATRAPIYKAYAHVHGKGVIVTLFFVAVAFVWTYSLNLNKEEI